MIPPEPQNFGFKFPASGSVPVLFSSMACMQQYLVQRFDDASRKSNNIYGNMKTCSNGASIVQHCWPNNVVPCWTNILSRFKIKPTSSNIFQHGFYTRPTCCIQQYWMMLDQSCFRSNRPLDNSSIAREETTKEIVGVKKSDLLTNGPIAL